MNLLTRSRTRQSQMTPVTSFQDSLEEAKKDRESVAALLWNGLVNIDYIVSEDVIVSQYDRSTLAKFSVKIDWEDFIIAIAMSDSLSSRCPTYPDRPHPFMRMEWFVLKVKDFIRTDIHPSSTFILYKKGSSNPLRTNQSFWNWIRKRIPATHPLSTI